MGIKLGTQVADRVTGYTGTVTARTEYLNDRRETTLLVTSKLGDLSHESWIAESRLAVVGEIPAIADATL